VTAQNYPSYSIIAGNPAKVIGYRFSQKVIDSLVELRWWDWEKDKIRKHLDILCSEDIEELLRS
jgi:hypothetical protein